MEQQTHEDFAQTRADNRTRWMLGWLFGRPAYLFELILVEHLQSVKLLSWKPYSIILRTDGPNCYGQSCQNETGHFFECATNQTLRPTNSDKRSNKIFHDLKRHVLPWPFSNRPIRFTKADALIILQQRRNRLLVFLEAGYTIERPQLDQDGPNDKPELLQAEEWLLALEGKQASWADLVRP